MNSEIFRAIKSVFAVAEDYPDLKASQNFLQLQAALNEVEEQLSAARRALVTHIIDYNNAVKAFPTNLIARIMKYEEMKWFEIPEEERVKPEVNELFKK